MCAQPTSAATLQALLGACPTPALALDGEGRILWANAALGALLGEDPEGLVGRTAADGGADLAALLCADERSQVRDRSGARHRLQRTRVALGGGVQLHYLSAITASDALAARCAALERELQALRLREPSTGLMNRRALLLTLEPQVSRSRRYGSPLAALALRVVVGAGHAEAGIRAVAQLLRDQLRWADLVACDEDGVFLALLPETDGKAAIASCEKLRAALARDSSFQDWRIGITQWRRSDDAERLLARARAALAQAQTQPDAAWAML